MISNSQSLKTRHMCMNYYTTIATENIYKTPHIHSNVHNTVNTKWVPISKTSESSNDDGVKGASFVQSFLLRVVYDKITFNCPPCPDCPLEGYAIFLEPRTRSLSGMNVCPMQVVLPLRNFKLLKSFVQGAGDIMNTIVVCGNLSYPVHNMLVQKFRGRQNH